MRRINSLILLFLSMSMFFFFQASPGVAEVKAGDPIKIGALGPLAITPGIDMKRGAELAVKEINAAGGVTVGGEQRDFELHVKTTSDPVTGLPDINTGVASLTELQSSINVTANIGLFRTEVTVACMFGMDRPFLGVGSTAPIINSYFWRVGPANGSVLAKSLVDLYAFGMSSLNATKVTIVRENAAWTLAVKNGVVYYLSPTYPALPNFTFSTTDVVIDEGAGYDAVKTALSAVSSDSQVLMTILSGPVGKHVGKAWGSLDMPQFLAGINVEAMAHDYFDNSQGLAYGEICVEIAPPGLDRTTKSAAFKTAYASEYGGDRPTYTSSIAYDSVYTLKEAIEDANSVEKADIQAALANIDYEGAGYHIRFTSEPGSQLGVDENGFPANITGAPTNITVHDMYTSATVGVRDTTYMQGFYAQWQRKGEKVTIWGQNPIATSNISASLEWPIDHADHGWTPDEDEESPGFEWPLILLVLGNLALITHLQRRRKR